MENIDKTFEACPVCSSKDRFFETLSQQLKDLGFARQEWRMFKDYKSGPVIDPAKEKSIPVGVEAPLFLIATDICLNCGTVYAVHLESGMVKKEVAPQGGKNPFNIPPSGDVRRN